MHRSFLLFTFLLFAGSCPGQTGLSATRQMRLLTGNGWQFIGAADSKELPEIGSKAFAATSWSEVSVPHNFQTQTGYDTITRGWYRRMLTVTPNDKDKGLYFVFGGAARLTRVLDEGFLG
jgi:hypothetical protein